MTNFSTVSQSISRLKKIDERLESDEVNILSKKEILKLTREREKLNSFVKLTPGTNSVAIILEAIQL